MIVSCRDYPMPYQEGYEAALTHLCGWFDRWDSWLGSEVKINAPSRKRLKAVMRTVLGDWRNLMLYGDTAEFVFRGLGSGGR